MGRTRQDRTKIKEEKRKDKTVTMRPASKTESAQTRPHVKPPKTYTKRKKKPAIEIMLKAPRVIKTDTQTKKKVKNYG